jgi:hypothetical protein
MPLMSLTMYEYRPIRLGRFRLPLAVRRVAIPRRVHDSSVDPVDQGCGYALGGWHVYNKCTPSNYNLTPSGLATGQTLSFSQFGPSTGALILIDTSGNLIVGMDTSNNVVGNATSVSYSAPGFSSPQPGVAQLQHSWAFIYTGSGATLRQIWFAVCSGPLNTPTNLCGTAVGWTGLSYTLNKQYSYTVVINLQLG